MSFALLRLLAAQVLSPDARTRLEAIAYSLDPVQLLQQIAALQDALWPLAIFPAPAVLPPDQQTVAEVRFSVTACLPSSNANPVPSPTPVTVQAPTPAGKQGSANPLPTVGEQKPRRDHRTKTPRGLRLWRTRLDPFAAVWEEIRLGLAAHPERTAKEALRELQQQHPGQFTEGQLRTLQRRVQEWRAKTILAFDDQWLQEEILARQQFPRSLQAIETTPPPPSTAPDAQGAPEAQTRAARAAGGESA